VTFDDGYRDYHDQAYPVLHELRIPAVVFLATAFVDRGGLIWTDAVNWAVHRSRRPYAELPWDGSRQALTSVPERDACVDASKAFLKNVSDAERTWWLAELLVALEVDPQDGAAGRQMLNWDEVRATMEYTRYGGHTHTHPILSQVGAREAEEEIRSCRDRIRAETGQAPRYFAYPNGRAQDFTEETKGILQRCGFELAFSTIEGIHQRGMDCYAIRRQPTGGRTIGDFAWLVAGH
jgi:peptidoglycan/xylan/chitin deacetylase (PgdA/CDA1 family)